MSNVSFEEEQAYRYAPVTSQTRGGIIGFLIRNKFATTESGAQYILITVVVLALATAALLIFKSSAHKNPPLPPVPPGTAIPAYSA